MKPWIAFEYLDVPDDKKTLDLPINVYGRAYCTIGVFDTYEKAAEVCTHKLSACYQMELNKSYSPGVYTDDNFDVYCPALNMIYSSTGAYKGPIKKEGA